MATSAALESLLFLGSSTAGLLLDDTAAKTPNLLLAVLKLLDLLAARVHGLVAAEAEACETVLGLELLQDLEVFVDQAETGRAITTELVAETEENDRLGVAVVSGLDVFL